MNVTGGLSAITANIGDITAGTIKGGSIPDANSAPVSSEAGAFMDLTGGKVVFGNANKHILFDGSNLILSGVTIDANSIVNSTAGVIVQEDGSSEATAATTLNFTTGLDVAVTGSAPTQTATISVASSVTSGLASETYVNNAIDNLVDGAPGTLNTLNEIAAAIADNSNFSGAMTTSLAGKVGTGSSQALTSASNALTISGSTITLTRGDGSTDTITTPNTNTQRTDEEIRDLAAGIITAGTNVTVVKNDVANTVTISSTDTQYTVGDGGLTQKNFTTTLKNKLDGIAAGATNTAAPFYTSAIAVGDGGLTQNNFTNADHSKLDGIAAGATNTAAPFYTSAIAVGDGGLTQNNFTNADHSKLDGITAGATNTAAPFYTSAIAVGDGGLTQKNFTTAFKTKLEGIAANATNTAEPFYTSAISVGDGGLTQKNFTTTLKNKLDGIAANATNTAVPFYTSAISVGDGGLTQKNFTTTLKNKLDGIAANATNTAVPFYTSAISVGDGGLTQKNFTTTLKNKLDGIAAGATNTAAPFYTSAIAVGDGGLTQNNFTNADHSKLDGIAASATNTAAPFYTSAIPNATASVTGLATSTQITKLDGIAANATNTAVPFYTSAIAVGDGGLTQKNFTTTLKNKLDGIAAGATNTPTPFYTSAIPNATASVTGLATSAQITKLDGIAANATNVTDNNQIGNSAGYITSADNGNAATFGNVAPSGYVTIGHVQALHATDAISVSGRTVTLKKGNNTTETITTQDTQYSVGDGGLTQKNFTTTLKNKLDGIAAGATNTAVPFYTSAIPNATASVTGLATSTQITKLDGISAGATNTAVPFYTSAISVGDGGLTQKNFTTTLKNKLDGISAGATNTAVPFYTSAISVGDGGLTQKNFTTTLKNKLDGIAASATNTAAPFYTSAIAVGDGGLTQNNFTNADHSKLDGIAANATNTAAPFYTSAIAVGDGGLTQNNFTNADHSKLDGIAAGANNYVFPYTVSVSASNSTVVQRHSSGYIFANYFNTTPNTVSTGVTQVCVETGNDGYIRHGNAASIRSFINVADGATNTAAPFYTSAIAVGDGGLTQNNFTNADHSKLDGIASGATNTAAPFYTSAIAVGDGGLTQNNFTNADHSKLDGIASGATNTLTPFYTSAIPNATASVTGLATSTQITKLDGIAANATNTPTPFYTSAISVGDGGLTQKNFTTTLKNKLDGIAAGATNTPTPFYTSAISVGDGGLTQKNFTTTLKNKLDGVAANANNFTYTHPSHPGDDINIDTTALTGATVISDLDFNITTDTDGHVTDANGTVATRNLTLSDLGYTGATNATANAGTVTSVVAGQGLTGGTITSSGTIALSTNMNTLAVSVDSLAANKIDVGVLDADAVISRDIRVGASGSEALVGIPTAVTTWSEGELFIITSLGNTSNTVWSNIAGTPTSSSSDGHIFYAVGDIIVVDDESYASGTGTGRKLTGQGAHLNTAGDFLLGKTSTKNFLFFDNTTGELLLSSEKVNGVSIVEGENKSIGIGIDTSITPTNKSVLFGFGSNGNGYGNTSIGAQSGSNISDSGVSGGSGQNAAENTSLGLSAGYSLSTGSNNVFLGSYVARTQAGATAIPKTGDRNIGIGGHSATADVLGGTTTFSRLSSGSNNIALGSRAAQNLSTGDSNIFVGTSSGYSMTTGSNNVIIGTFSGNAGGYDIRTSSNNLVLSDGAGNIKLKFDTSANATFTGKVTTSGSLGMHAPLLQASDGTQSLQVAVSSSYNYLNSYINSSGASKEFRILMGQGSSTKFTLDTSGNGTFVGNVTAYSDERLKSDIETLDGKKVLEMRGVEFIKDGVKGSGVIAQELEKIAPELVLDGDYKSVAYGNLTGYLIEAIKEQQSEINQLKDLVKQLLEK
jgi:hypothetical protein